MNRGFVFAALLVLLFAGSGPVVWGQQNQIQNPEFDSGLDSWFLYGGAGFTASVVPGARLSGANAALIDITDASASVTSIGIAQGGLTFEKGKKYPIGLTARADREREMVILIQLYKPEVPNWIDIVMQRVPLTTEPQTFLYEYTHNDDNMADHPAWQATMYLMLKGQWWTMEGADVASKVWVDRVHVGEQPPLVDSTIRHATAPQPANEATDVPRDASLNWTAGESTTTRDVYFGTSFDDVNSAGASDSRGVLVSQGQTDIGYDPEALLEYGRTYYWRIDEVNGAPDYTLFKGEVWSFTVEPYAYPITSVTAEASGEQSISPAIRTIDGSGLDEFDQHGTDLKTMWVTPGGLPAWILYTFDKVYKLHELWVWNGNSDLELLMGFGAKDVTIEYSTDGQTWAQVQNVPPFAQGTATATYTANNIIDLGEVMAQHVRLNISDNWGATAMVCLSEVRFFHTPMQAFEPVPADGTRGVDLGATLTWRPGREATSHEVYFGTDANAVVEGVVTAETVTDRSFTPASTDFGTTYYWRVDEAGDAGT
ncbi:MAG: carbohydrate binding domain-containing protein, partial [Phycisphaerales bacterium]